VVCSFRYILYSERNDREHGLTYLYTYMDNMPCIVAVTFEYFKLRLLLAAEVKGGTRK
jgi:hypothetical protein